jgi:hypothetical protein
MRQQKQRRQGQRREAIGPQEKGAAATLLLGRRHDRVVVPVRSCAPCVECCTPCCYYYSMLFFVVEIEIGAAWERWLLLLLWWPRLPQISIPAPHDAILWVGVGLSDSGSIQMRGKNG